MREQTQNSLVGGMESWRIGVSGGLTEEMFRLQVTPLSATVCYWRSRRVSASRGVSCGDDVSEMVA